MALTDNLTAYWSLESSGTDATGRGNTATPAGSTSFGAGKVSNGLVLSGGYATVPDGPDVEGSGAAWTFAAWIKPTALSVYAAAKEPAWRIYLRASNTRIYYSTDNATWPIFDAPVILATGVWSFIQLRYNGTQLQFRVNGGAWTSVTVGTLYNGAGSLYLGYNASPMQGGIDEAGIWQRSLDDAELNTLYNAGAGMSYADIVAASTPAVTAQVSQVLAETALNADGGAAVQVSQTVGEAVWSSSAMCFSQVAQDVAEAALNAGGAAMIQEAQTILEVVWAQASATDPGEPKPPVEETDEQTPGVFYYDERDGRIYSVVLPPKPDLPDATPADIVDTLILALTGTHNVKVDDTAGWTVDPPAGGFSLAEWQTGPLGTGAFHMDTTGALSLADVVYYDYGLGNGVDLSTATQIEITIREDQNEALVNTPLFLLLGESGTPTDWMKFPITVTAKGVTQNPKIDLSAIPDSQRDKIRYIGFMAASTSPFAVWMANLRFSSGLTGVSRYKIRDTRVQGWQMPQNTENVLPSPECPGPDDDDLKVDTGTNGAQVTLTRQRSSLPAGLAWWEIYRSDEDETGRYHWIANWPAHDRWQPSMTQCASAKPSPRAWRAGDTVRPPTLDKARVGDEQYFFTVKTIANVPNPKTGAYLRASDEPNWDAVVAAGVGATVTDGDITWELKTAADHQNVLVYVDTEQDIADNPMLEEDRVHVPVPPTGLGIYDNRLVLYVTNPDERTKKQYIGNLWLSGRDNHADWHDWGPESWPELETFNFINDASACRLPMSEAGQAVRMIPLGAWTGAAYTGPLCILTQGGQSGQAIALQGTVPSLNPEKDGLSIGHRVPHGSAGPYAATRDGDGRILTATPDGEIVALDRELNHTVLSEQLDEWLKHTPPSGRVRWVMGYDPTYHRLVLATLTRMFAFDGTGWDEMDPDVYGRPTCAATVAGAGGFLVFGEAELAETAVDPGATGGQGDSN